MICWLTWKRLKWGLPTVLGPQEL
uniref:Uncharacterized protein n=1 Tax=Arundo donax TaxID=35708 RepID=A0A0A8YM87_ARUDO